MGSILEIQALCVRYRTDWGTVYALNDVTLELEEGETLGLLGETGAGKTTLAKSIMRLIPSPPGKVEGGHILFQGEDLLKIDEKGMRSIRGNRISMIFQDPMSALNPVMTAGKQIEEVIHVHENRLSAKDVRGKALEMLETVGIPTERADDYPHQFSGGMRQRVVIAAALACNPKVLVADEPTTALDVTIQAQVLEMMKSLKKAYGTAILLITHNLGVIAQMCDRAAVLYAGEIVESAPVSAIFGSAMHPYTKGLLDAIPRIHLNQRRLRPIEGLMPDPTRLPEGCCFSDRCGYAFDRCKTEHPQLQVVGERHKVRCFRQYSM